MSSFCRVTIDRSRLLNCRDHHSTHLFLCWTRRVEPSELPCLPDNGSLWNRIVDVAISLSVHGVDQTGFCPDYWANYCIDFNSKISMISYERVRSVSQGLLTALVAAGGAIFQVLIIWTTFESNFTSVGTILFTLCNMNVLSLTGIFGTAMCTMFYAAKLSCGGYIPVQQQLYATTGSLRSRQSAPV